MTVTPEIQIPADCALLAVSREGDVAIHRDAGEPEKIGTIALGMFVDPAQLTAAGEALFKPSERSGTPQLGRPSDGLRGGLVQHALERSNVDVDGERQLLRQIDEWLQTIHAQLPVY
jgi:flagellar basal body rod protein FlgG